MGKPQSDSKQDYGWFERFVINLLQRYAHQASAGHIFKKYAGLPKDFIAARYIAVQARVALLAGGVSALIVSTAQLASGAAVLGEVALPGKWLSKRDCRYVQPTTFVYCLECR